MRLFEGGDKSRDGYYSKKYGISGKQPRSLGTLRCCDGDDNENIQKSNQLNKQNNNSARAARFFVHFFTVTARRKISQRENA